IAGGITLNGGSNVGLIHVYTASATIAGGTPKVGEYAQATGTGSLGTSITADYVALYSAAPGSVVLTGSVTSAKPYGFAEAAGSAQTPIVLNNATIVGGSSLVLGAQIKVTGTGTSSEGILAQQIVVSAPSPSPGASATPTPGPIAQKHLLTADYLGAPYGTTAIAWSQAAPYLSWAQTQASVANGVHAAGIKTQFYADPNRTQSGTGDPLFTTNEAAFAHDCSGNRVTDTYAGSKTQYVMNVGGATMQSEFQQYLAQITSYAHFDAIYEDDAGPLSEEIYTPFSAMPCGYSDASWIASENALDQSVSVPILFNGLDALDGQGVSESVGLLGSSNTMGGNYEDCYADNSTAKMNGWLWQTIENSELQVNARGKTFECQLRSAATASTQSDARIYGLASFLLTYNPASSIFWEEYATPSGLHVEPESQLVVLNPLTPAPASIAGLQVSGGTYGRQYANCYYAGNFVGPCAVVVNPDSQSSHPFPYPQYTHTLVLSGGGVIDGGTVATNGPAPPLNLAPNEAAIVFP
ncbi:MAG: hypothetical protein JO199_03185, partial [Candidatus Eremiobacteraeota bacterium]|nr:hypothetical protein [Candidatus Eremiobacteraeota bacterium]